MALSDSIAKYGSFLRIIPVTLTNGQISAFGSAIDFLEVAAETPTYGKRQKDPEYNTLTLTSQVSIRQAKVTDVYDQGTGSAVSATGEADKIEIETMLYETKYDALRDIAIAGTPVVITKGFGYKASGGTITGFEHLLGTIDVSPAENSGIPTMKGTVTGGESYSFDGTATIASFNTALTGSTITPLGGSAITLTGITASGSEETEFLAGNIVKVSAT